MVFLVVVLIETKLCPYYYPSWFYWGRSTLAHKTGLEMMNNEVSVNMWS